ncbi:MAG: hypothetical protein HKN73_03130, partial [Gemmatimonadetes bacterium]|nr:hypothetical protein [Gemmatimonadota bacterium]
WVTFAIGGAALLVAIDPPTTILWIVTMAFSLMTSAFTFPFLLGVWWRGATREGGIAGMTGGVLACLVWYVLGYIQHGTFDNWIGGIWPALVGPAVSLVCLVAVSRITSPTPDDVLDTFFADAV